MFVINSILKKTKMNPDDYFPVSKKDIFKLNIENSDVVIDKYLLKKSNVFNSYKFNILLETYTNQSLKDLTSVSFREDDIFSKSNKAKTEDENLILEVIDNIKKYGGTIVENIYDSDYAISNDNCNDYVYNVINKIKKGESKCIVVSHRFIQHCINKKAFINMKKDKLFHLLPMPFKTPIKSFENTVIKFRGFDKNDKDNYEEIVKLLGGKFDSDNVTHLIISEKNYINYEKIKSELEKNHYNNVKIIALDWMLECCLNGCRVDEELYLVEKRNK